MSLLPLQAFWISAASVWHNTAHGLAVPIQMAPQAGVLLGAHMKLPSWPSRAADENRTSVSPEVCQPAALCVTVPLSVISLGGQGVHPAHAVAPGALTCLLTFTAQAQPRIER